MDNDTMTADAALTVLRECVAAHLDIDVSELPPGTDVAAELGLDSLDIIEVVDMVEGRIGAELPGDMFDGDTSLESLAARLAGFLAER